MRRSSCRLMSARFWLGPGLDVSFLSFMMNSLFVDVAAVRRPWGLSAAPFRLVGVQGVSGPFLALWSRAVRVCALIEPRLPTSLGVGWGGHCTWPRVTLSRTLRPADAGRERGEPAGA